MINKNRVHMAQCTPWKKWQSDENEVQDNNNETMKMGKRVTLVLFHKPCRKDEDDMTAWMNDTWYSMYEDHEDHRFIKTRKI